MHLEVGCSHGVPVRGQVRPVCGGSEVHTDTRDEGVGAYSYTYKVVGTMAGPLDGAAAAGAGRQCSGAADHGSESSGGSGSHCQAMPWGGAGVEMPPGQ